MPTCIVADCDSGTFRQERRSSQLNERTAFFKFPRDPELTKKWKQSLKFKENYERMKEKRICHRHFRDEDIVKVDEITLANGVVWRSERQHFKVKHGAIPFYSGPELIIPDTVAFIKVEVDSNSCGSNTPEDTPPQPCLSEVHSPPDDQNLFLSNSHDHHETNTADEQIKTPKDIIRQYTVNNQLSQQKKLQANTKISPPVQINLRAPNNLDNQENRAPGLQDPFGGDLQRKSLLNDHQYLSYLDFKKTIVPQQTELGRDIPKPRNEEEISAEESRVSNDDVQNSRTPSCDEFTEEPIAEVIELPFETLLEPSQSTLDDIMDFLRKTPLPRTWSWMKFTKKDNGFTFTQIDCTYRIVRMFVELYEDLSMKVITGDGKAGAKVRVELSSVNSIIDALYSMEKLELCMGTGDDFSSPVREEDCYGVVLRNQRKYLKPYGRCAACQKSRMKVKMKQQLKKIPPCKTDTDIKNEDLKKEVKLLKRKCKYYEDKTNLQSKKINSMIEMIKTVNSSMSEKKYEVP